MANITGGYPNSTDTRATSVIDQEVIALIKAQEIIVGNRRDNDSKFTVSDMSILVDAEALAVVNGGTIIHLDPAIAWNNDVRIKTLVFKTVVSYRLTYNY